MAEYADDDGIRAENMPLGQLTHILGLISAGGDEVQTGLTLLEDFVTRVSTLAGFTPGMLDQLLARLAIVEAATGTGTIIADQIIALTGQLKAIRSTRYYGRPGEGPTSWTADTTSIPANANPLAVGAPYSISTDGGGGIALRITGAGAVVPIALTRLDDLQIITYRFVVSRFTDDATTANNIPRLEGRCFKADGTYLGSVVFPVADPLLKAQGVVPYSFQVSPTAGLGTVNLPAGTRYIRPFVGNIAGALDVYAVDLDAQAGNSLATAVSRNVTNYRPGEIISSWTAQTQVGDPLLAIPLKTDSAYSIVNGVEGKALRVSSPNTIGIGPIYSRVIRANDIIEYQPFLRRVVNGTTAVITMRVAVFDDDWSYFGFLSIGTFSPDVIAGQVSPRFRCAAADVFASFPGAARIRPYLAMAPTNGAVEISSLEIRPLTISSGAKLRDADLEILKTASWIAVDPVTGEPLSASADAMAKFLEYQSMRETFPFKIRGQTADSKSKVVILPDDQRARFQIQCENADLAINIHGGKATFDADDPVLFAGGLYEFENKGYDAVSVIARKPVFRTDVAFSGSAKLAIDYDRKVPVGYISGNATGDQAISNYPDQDMSKLWRAILRDRINILSDLGIWDKQDVWMPPVHAKINLTVNLAKPDVPVTIVEGENKMLFVPYRWYGSGGVGAYLSTGLSPATGLRISVDSHLMGCQVEAGAFETGIGVAGNSTSLILKPNAASGKAGMRSGGSANDTFDAAATAWIAMLRNAADKYLGYVETVTTEKPAALTVAERVLTVCAVNTASQLPPTVSNQKLKCFHMGPQLQDQAKVLNLREAWKAIFAVGDTL